MKHTLYIYLTVLALAGCSHIAEDERYIEVKPDIAAQPRRVLLEDFTGQRCVNCPRGAEVIEQLQQQLGDNAVIAVGIHGGPLGFSGTAAATGLATPLGDTYYNHWKLEYQPVGLVNRGSATNYTDWTTAVIAELAKPVVLNLTATSTVNEGQMDITVEATAVDHDVTGRLQVWVVEDGITALQMMPDGSTNRTYVHNHVLRTAVNGDWGEDVSIALGTPLQLTFRQAIDEAWQPTRLYAVAFVYDDSGVLQAATSRLLY